jgi:hypothetical protein
MEIETRRGDANQGKTELHKHGRQKKIVAKILPLYY